MLSTQAIRHYTQRQDDLGLYYNLNFVSSMLVVDFQSGDVLIEVHPQIGLEWVAASRPFDTKDISHNVRHLRSDHVSRIMEMRADRELPEINVRDDQSVIFCHRVDNDVEQD